MLDCLAIGFDPDRVKKSSDSGLKGILDNMYLKFSSHRKQLQSKMYLSDGTFPFICAFLKSFQRETQYPTILFFLIVTILFSVYPASGGSCSDDHNDNVLTDWTALGKRTWSEIDGYAVPGNSDQWYKGFLINDHLCTRDGVFICRLNGSGDLNSLDGGVVFRFTDMSHYYFVTIAEANSSGQSSDNRLMFLTNSTDVKNGYTIIGSGLDFYNCNSVYTLKIQLTGPTYTFWLNGDSIGQVTDTTNMSGSVGYAYDDLPNPYVKYDSSAWIDANSNYSWDVSRNAGVQAGNGVWGIDNFWTPSGDNGSAFYAWPGAGNSATFEGTDGNYTITVKDTQSIDSMSFLNGTYSIIGGAISVGTKNGIYVAADKIAIVGTILMDAESLSKYGEGTLVLAGNTDFKGTMFINDGTLEIGYGGSTGGIDGPIVNEGTLLDNRNDTNSFGMVISGPGKFLKKGTGILALNGTNTYTGSTTIASGRLVVNGAINKSSSVSVTAGAVLSGTGICSGVVIVNDGMVDPGGVQSGKLTIGELRLDENSILNFDLGIESDTIAVDGMLVLDGTVNFSSVTGLPLDTCRIITYSGTLINNTLKTGSIPPGLDCKLIYGDGYVDAVFSDGLIKMEPNDTTVPVGTAAFFSVETSGGNQLIYKWIRTPSDSVGNMPSYTTGPVTIAHNGSCFRCVVRDRAVIDSSRWAVLTVIDTPRIVLQPQNTSVAAGIDAVFSISLKDTIQTIYSWRKVGSDSEIGRLRLLTIKATTFSDSGDYYCIVSNPAGSCKSFVVHLTVQPNTFAAAFSFAPKNGLAPLNVVFTDNSTGDITSRLWMFGDSSSSTDINPKHTYTKPGIYIVSLVVTSSQGSNTLIKTDSVHVYSNEINQEIITFFNSNKVDDTISAFSGRVSLWKKDSSYSGTGNNTDTLVTISFTSLPVGMVPVGLPLSIMTNAIVVPFYVGIHIDSLPKGTSISNVKIYSYNGSKFYVNYTSQFDSIKRMVYARVDGHERVFIPMIDTVAPKITVYSNPAIPVMPGAEVNDVIGITDNITNVRWKYFCGSGNTLPVLYRQGVTDSNGTILSITIPDTAAAICSWSGLRILLLIDDGNHYDTINLSRSVYRVKSDTMTITANRWNPVYSTAVLYSKDPDSILDPLMKYFNVKTYNNKYFRLFQWLSTADNSTASDKWVEYDSYNKSIHPLFTFEPGRMYWLKTRENVPMHMGSGYTISLRDTLTLGLQAKQWTDISMPYPFGVRMEEIITASGSDIDFISVYRWQRNKFTEVYNLEPLYVPGMPDKEDNSTIIDYSENDGYSIYNSHSKNVLLRVPPIPASNQQALKKKTNSKNSSWSLKFVVQNDKLKNHSTVYLGYTQGNHTYPPMPSFSDVTITVLDRATMQQYGHSINENARNGFVKELLVSNTGDSTHSLQYHFEKAGAYPSKYLSYCHNVNSGDFDTCGTISVAPHSLVSRWIIAGDTEFHKNFISRTQTQQFALCPFFPNPSRSFVNIRFTVPFGTREHVKITICNVLGKIVWQKQMKTFLRHGSNQVTWNGTDNDNIPVGSGLYVVLLEVKNEAGEVKKRFQQSATLLQ